MRPARKHRKLSLPVIHEFPIADRFEEVLSVSFFDQEASQIAQSRATRTLQHDQDRVVKYGGHLVTPTCRESPKHADEVRSDEVFLQFRVRGQNVESDGIRIVRRIEQNYIVTTRVGNSRQDFVDEIPVRIKHGEAPARLHILGDQIQ